MSRQFREVFQFANKDITHYFPGHMPRGLKQMQRTLKHVDAIIEVHDARIPFSGRNPHFNDTITLRPHMLVLNKVDLVPQYQRSAVANKLKSEGINKILYTNCKEQTHFSIKNKFLPAVFDMLDDVPRFNRTNVEAYNLLVIGVPNVGKSSLINALRRTHLKKGKATRVGGESGITRSVEEKIRVSSHPLIYVYDTPGILSPQVQSMDAGMKLAACNTLKDHLVGEDVIADYVLFWLNKHEYFRYVHAFDLDEPTDNIHALLLHICKTHNFTCKVNTQTGTGRKVLTGPNLKRAADYFLRAFRTGELGKINMDMDLLELDNDEKQDITM